MVWKFQRTSSKEAKMDASHPCTTKSFKELRADEPLRCHNIDIITSRLKVIHRSVSHMRSQMETEGLALGVQSDGKRTKTENIV